jgi:hypothetical protein
VGCGPHAPNLQQNTQGDIFKSPVSVHMCWCVTVPTRVTISVPDDLHAAIQAARGRILLDWSIDVPYSAIVELLTIGGVETVAQYYRGSLTDRDAWALSRRMREGFERASETAGGVVGDLPVDQIVQGMLPNLVKKTLPEVVKQFGKDLGPDGNFTPEAKRASERARRKWARRVARASRVTGSQHDQDRALPSRDPSKGAGD